MDAGGIAMRINIGCFVLDGIGVKYDQVCVGAGNNPTTLFLIILISRH